MSDITLPYPRSEAVTLVEATFERMANVESYDVVENGDVVVGTTGGGLTSLGEEVVVEFSRRETHDETANAESGTPITVNAQARHAHNLSANPWRHKADFVKRLNEVQETPIEELAVTVDDDTEADDDTGADHGTHSTGTSDAMVLGAKFMLVAFAGLLVVAGVFAAVTALLL